MNLVYHILAQRYEKIVKKFEKIRYFLKYLHF